MRAYFVKVVGPNTDIHAAPVIGGITVDSGGEIAAIGAAFVRANALYPVRHNQVLVLLETHSREGRREARRLERLKMLRDAWFERFMESILGERQWQKHQ